MQMNEAEKATARLLEVMDTLRRECPWDREQTFDTLRNNTIEEVYELADAITDKNMEGIKEELGDLLLHVAFYSKLGDEQGAFDYTDVANGVCDKLIYRHPHVYGDIHADTPEEVKQNWEALKLRKKKRKSGTLGGVPVSLPAMVKAFRVGEKAAAVGFDWEKREDVWAKVREELGEVDAEIEAKKIELLNAEEYASVRNEEVFAELVKDHANISYEELQSKCDQIILDAVKSGKYSAVGSADEPVVTSKKQFTNPTVKKTKPSRYGKLFAKEKEND